MKNHLFQKASIFIPLLVILCIVDAFSKDAVTSTQKSTDSLNYNTLLERVKASNPDIDFFQLRMVYANTSDYDPYNDELSNYKKSMYDALNDNNYKEAIEHARGILKRNYVDIDAHLVCEIAYDGLKNAEKRDYHSYIADGLIESILHSGDGKSPETAFIIIDISEEYEVLRSLELRFISQELLGGSKGPCDLLKAYNPESGDTLGIYFNVSILFDYLSKKFK